MNHTILLVLVLTLLSSFPARAQEDLPPFGSYKALGAGAQVVCGAFIAEMGKGPQADQLLGHTVISWVHGYVTAYNETLSKSPEIKGDRKLGCDVLRVGGAAAIPEQEEIATAVECRGACLNQGSEGRCEHVGATIDKLAVLIERGAKVLAVFDVDRILNLGAHARHAISCNCDRDMVLSHAESPYQSRHCGS